MVGEVTERIAVERGAGLSDEIKLRVASGLVLAGTALAVNWWGVVPFAVLVALIAGVIGWEWARVVRGSDIDAPLIVQTLAVVLATLAAALGLAWLGFLIAIVGAAGAGVAANLSRRLLSVLGVIYVAIPAVALIWLRSDVGAGALAVLFVLITVWTTDTFAFCCGKLIGGPKLWSALSPNKTWAGSIGGTVFAGIAGLGFALATGNASPLTLALVAVLLSIAGQAGDLVESSLKRVFGFKHASRLIPGHGGFMDRMDSVVAAALMAALIALLRNSAAPASALLTWA